MDKALFNASDNKFTTKGFTAYWEAVDKVVKFADTLLLKKEAHKKAKSSPKTGMQRHSSRDHFHWSRF